MHYHALLILAALDAVRTQVLFAHRVLLLWARSYTGATVVQCSSAAEMAGLGGGVTKLHCPWLQHLGESSWLCFQRSWIPQKLHQLFCASKCDVLFHINFSVSFSLWSICSLNHQISLLDSTIRTSKKAWRILSRKVMLKSPISFLKHLTTIIKLAPSHVAHSWTLTTASSMCVPPGHWDKIRWALFQDSKLCVSLVTPYLMQAVCFVFYSPVTNRLIITSKSEIIVTCFFL